MHTIWFIFIEQFKAAKWVHLTLTSLKNPTLHRVIIGNAPRLSISFWTQDKPNQHNCFVVVWMSLFVPCYFWNISILHHSCLPAACFTCLNLLWMCSVIILVPLPSIFVFHLMTLSANVISVHFLIRPLLICGHEYIEFLNKARYIKANWSI